MNIWIMLLTAVLVALVLLCFFFLLLFLWDKFVIGKLRRNYNAEKDRSGKPGNFRPINNGTSPIRERNTEDEVLSRGREELQIRTSEPMDDVKQQPGEAEPEHRSSDIKSIIGRIKKREIKK